MNWSVIRGKFFELCNFRSCVCVYKLQISSNFIFLELRFNISWNTLPLLFFSALLKYNLY